MKLENEYQRTEKIEKANEILLEYFRHNRYPKKAEKVKLADTAGVPLQFVMNFFYETRSKIKKREKQQKIFKENYVLLKDSYSYVSLESNSLFNGKNNDLYRNNSKQFNFLYNPRTHSMNDISIQKIRMRDEYNENERNYE